MWEDPFMAWEALPASPSASATKMPQPSSHPPAPVIVTPGMAHLPVLQISTPAPLPQDSVPDLQDQVKSQTVLLQLLHCTCHFHGGNFILVGIMI